MMPLLIARGTPVEWDVWYDVHLESVRRFRTELGLISDTIYRDHSNPRTFVALMEVESVEKALAFIASDAHMELVSRAALEGEPVFWTVDRMEEVDVGRD